MSKKKVLISASGTGGHLFPAQDLAHLLKKQNFEIFFAASDLSKKKTFDKDTFDFVDISSSMVNKKNILVSGFRIFKGLLQSLILIHKFKPEIVVGFGSYHTFPVVLAAYILRKKIVLFDSNTTLGKVNKFFSKKARIIATQFPIEKSYENHMLVKRLPWSVNVKEEKDFFFDKNLKKDLFTILIFGGSQGAKIINDNFLEIIEELSDLYQIQVVHIVGLNENISEIKKIYQDLEINSYVKDFEKDLMKFYKLADLVISRSGASTISELIYFDVPSILIPFKKAADNHQLKNALYVKNTLKGSEIISEDNLNSETLLNAISNFLKDDQKKLCNFKENIQEFKKLEAKSEIKHLSDLILEIYHE